MEDNQEEKNAAVENAKTVASSTAKFVSKKASSAIGKYALAIIGPILPYIAIVILVVVIVSTVYLGIEYQSEEILSAAEDFGEKIGNAMSMYGFKTNNENAIFEEEKFYKAADFYKEYLNLSVEEILLVERTLLYEGNNEDRIYFTDSTGVYNKEENEEDIKSSDSAGLVYVLKRIYNFGRQFNIVFTQGFTNSFLGSSKFRKGIKFMPEPVTAVIKCKLLTDETVGDELFSACYKGYLVAEYDKELDKLGINYNIQPGYLVLGKNKLEKVLMGIYENEQDRIDAFMDIGFYISSWIKAIIFKQTITVIAPLPSLFFGSATIDITQSFLYNFYLSSKNVMKSIERIITMMIFGSLATGEDKHFYYDGYIVNHLREYYKLSYDQANDNPIDYSGDKPTILLRSNYHNLDIEMIQKEIELREEIADEIIHSVDTYYIMRNGEKQESKKSTMAPVMANNEKDMSVKVTIGGKEQNISFDDYVMYYVIDKYSSELDSIKNDPNYDEKLKALISIARTEIYVVNNIDSKTVSITGNSTIANAGYDAAHKNFSDSDIAKFKELIGGTRGNVIRVDGKPTSVNKQQIQDILNNVSNDKNNTTAIKDVVPGANVGPNGGILPIPQDIYDLKGVSDDYGVDRGYNKKHGGIDFPAPENTPIYAIHEGTLVYSGWSDSFGWVAVVDYNGNKMIYAHMNGFADFEDNNISKGQPIGFVGNTGDSRGNHLHLEIRVGEWGNRDADRVNPWNVINGKGFIVDN